MASNSNRRSSSSASDSRHRKGAGQTRSRNSRTGQRQSASRGGSTRAPKRDSQRSASPHSSSTGSRKARTETRRDGTRRPVDGTGKRASSSRRPPDPHRTQSARTRRSGSRGKVESLSDARSRGTSSRGTSGKGATRSQRTTRDGASRKRTDASRRDAGLTLSTPTRTRYREPSVPSPSRHRDNGSANARSRSDGSRKRSARSADGARTVRRLQYEKQGRKLAAHLKPLLSRLAMICAIVALLVIGGYALYRSPLLPVTQVTVSGNSYLTTQEILDTAQVPADATLLRTGAKQIEARLLANPWIKTVKVKRALPDRLSIVVVESGFDAVVEVPVTTASSTATRWAISSNGLWLSQIKQTDTTAQTTPTPTPTPSPAPTPTDASTGETFTTPMATPADDVSQTTDDSQIDQSTLDSNIAANVDGKPKIVDVASTVKPAAGTINSDPGITAALKILTSVSNDLSRRITTVSAPDAETVTVTLDNGVEIAFGSVSDVATKERVATEIMNAHPGSVSYINVRVVDRPAWRGL